MAIARRTAVLLAVGVVVTVTPLVVVGVSEHSHAADVRAQERKVAAELRVIDAVHRGNREHLRAVRTASRRMSNSLVAMLDAFRTKVRASNQAAEVANRAVSLFNEKQPAAAIEVLQSEGRAAGLALEAATARVRTALTAAQHAAKDLRSAAHG